VQHVVEDVAADFLASLLGLVLDVDAPGELGVGEVGEFQGVGCCGAADVV
jgi:hypothetical protein